MLGANQNARHEPMVSASDQTALIDKLELTLYELREGGAEEFYLPLRILLPRKLRATAGFILMMESNS